MNTFKTPIEPAKAINFNNKKVKCQFSTHTNNKKINFLFVFLSQFKKETFENSFRHTCRLKSKTVHTTFKRKSTNMIKTLPKTAQTIQNEHYVQNTKILVICD